MTVLHSIRFILITKKKRKKAKLHQFFLIQMHLIKNEIVAADKGNVTIHNSDPTC